VLGLEVTESARNQLRRLRKTNPRLFEMIGERITEVRHDPGGRYGGRTFLLADGRTARLATFYDHVETAEVCLVWLVRDDGSGPAMVVIWAGPFVTR
jgi:hypothetical protein